MVCAAAVAASGLTWAGFGLNDPADEGGRTNRAAGKSALTEEQARGLARDSGKNVEITDLRTATSSTFAQPDGLMAKRLYATSVWAKSGGAWKAIDRNLHRTKDGWEPKVTNTRIVFSPGTSAGKDRASRTAPRRLPLLPAHPPAAEPVVSPLATLVTGDHEVRLSWPGAIPTPVVVGNQILYPEILPGADLVLTADDDGFAQLLVVKDRTAAADPRVKQLSYGLSSPDLTFRLDPRSKIVTAENSFGDEVAESPSPLMWDNAGHPAVTDGQVGASDQPTAPVTLAPEPTAPETGGPALIDDGAVDSDEQTDPEGEILPSAGDEVLPAESESPLPTAPAEPTPGPTQPGSAATLSLPGLAGPSPDSHGALVDADLAGSNWVLTPDQEMLEDPATVFPVFIDPSVKKHVQNWTTAYKKHPKSTFYNGKGFNKSGTHEARVGFESDTWGTSRSFFNIDFDKTLKGTQISSAKLTLLETYSWSCQARPMSVHLTSEIGSKTNWNNAPKLNDGNKIQARSFAHGYKSGCRDAYEAFNVRSAAQKAADKGWDTITFGLRATDENSRYSWKKFTANGDHAPVLELVYNRRPEAPTALDLSPDSKCTTTKEYIRMGAGEIFFTATASDKDKNLDAIDFDLWPTGKWDTTGDLLKSTGKVSVGGDTGTARRTTAGFPTSKLVNGTLYSWRARALDDKGATSSYSPKTTPCRFVLDTAAPRPPEITSTDFPNADDGENGFSTQGEDAIWSTKKFGTPGTFTVRALSTDVVKYEYGFNSASYTGTLARTAGTAVTVKGTISNAKPPTAGPNVLYVRTVDSAGNVSDPTKYFFYVTPRDQADSPGDFTGDKLPDLFTVTAGGSLALYPSQATSTDLNKGSGDLDYSMAGAYRENPERDPNGGDGKAFYSAAAPKHFDKSLITHNGDIYGGDGLQDLVVRVEGKLWVYPGDGYGGVNTDKRREILLPAGAPDPADITQIVSAGDATGDGKADFFLRVGDALWALTGYNGATVAQATRLSSSPWTERDIVTVLDVTGDGITDLVYRTDVSGRLLLRTGIKSPTGGVDLTSLASAANSATGVDAVYGASGWYRASIPHIMGTPDANGDGVPDIWTVRTDGSVRVYFGSRTTLTGSGTEVIGANTNWKTRQTIG